MKLASIVVMCGLWTGVAAAAEFTASKQLANITYGADNQTLYFEPTVGKWGSAGCPNAQYVLVTGTAMNPMLSIGLSAKLGERSVRFYGTCYSADYFQADRIVLE